MARNPKLSWFEITDFTGGLWNKDSSFLMPNTAFQTLTDAWPQKDGGVRAFYKPADLGTTGIGSTTTERPVHMQTQVISTGIQYLLFTHIESTGQLKAYFRDVGASSWTLSKTFSDVAGSKLTGAFVDTCTYAAGSVLYFAVAVGHTGSDDGIWTYRPDTTTWTNIHAVSLFGTVFSGPPVLWYQGSLVHGQLNSIVWTDPGTVTFGAANFVTIITDNLDAGAIISGIIAHHPSNLIVSTVNRGWYSVEGDLEDPEVTSMGNTHYTGVGTKLLYAMDDGIVFREADGGLYMAQNNASTFERLDSQLQSVVGTNWQGMELWRDLLFAPGGRVLDTKTGAWFTLSEGTEIDNYSKNVMTYINDIQLTPAIWALPYKSGWTLPGYTLEEGTANRYETYTVKTAPLQNGQGQETTIEEVEVFIKNTHASGTVAVTVGGTTVTVTPGSTGLTKTVHRFRKRGRYLDVQVVPNSNSSGTEAPIIEMIRIGSRTDGHQYL